IEKERPDALLPNLGGQTALNLASKLNEEGILKQYNVEVIGVDLEAIARGEDRIIFKETMDKIGVPVAKSEPVYTVEEAEKVAAELGYPVVLRPAYTMGGTGGGIVYNVEELRQVVPRGLAASLINQVLVEECVLGWEELELEVVRDAKGQKITVCFIENVDPMGVHTGDSFCVAPMLTVPQDVQDRLQDYSYRILDAIGVTGGTNVQFAHNREDNRIIVIEINPRTSRSSALASKATGFPIASVSTKLASGITMDELPYWRKGSLEKYEPYGDYVVVKFARWAFEKFPKAADKLGTQMKAVGEVMSIGQNFKEAFQKAVRSLEIGRAGLGRVKKLEALTTPELREKITYGNSERFFQIYELLRRGVTVEEIVKLTRITPYFIEQMKELADFDYTLDAQTWDSLPVKTLHQAKEMGFSDKYLAQIFGVPEKAIRTRRIENGIVASYRIVPVSGVEYAEYYYSTYSGAPDEVAVSDKKKIMILGGGPNRIGQGIEFDYTCVHAAFTLRDNGYESIMINCNPETVSTDFDTANKLYFEPVTVEDVLTIYEKEKPEGVIVQFGGQTPLNIAQALKDAGVKIMGTQPEGIRLAEDREYFRERMIALNIRQPESGTARSLEEAVELGRRIGYPVMVRPSFVLGGRGMEVIYDEENLKRYGVEAIQVSPEYPMLIDRFLDNAIEAEVDALADGTDTFVATVMEHIELAGIHSGDSASMIPAMGISMKMHKEITRASKELARRLNVCGLMNIQFAVKDEQLYVIEVNPRASRTVPFVSKAIGKPLAKLAAQIMAGKTLAELGFTREITPEYHCVKEAVFPWGRFPGIDVVLGPEMKSTGEVMGIDPDPDIAFAKSQVSAFNPLPTEGKVFISVNDRDKERVLHMARQLADMGFILCATRGTMIHLLQHDIECERAYKVNEERRPNIVDHIKNGEINFIINTPGSHDARADDIIIRSSAIATKTSYCTNLASAQACVNAIEALKNRTLQVRIIQEYHAETL
ncbi:MAG: carbamoyl-phosphate synthase large subunit, partial [Akkermansia sp.]|nr:carbamoyl-phosphate synthase large subunit [Akkermansia sp.]